MVERITIRVVLRDVVPLVASLLQSSHANGQKVERVGFLIHGSLARQGVGLEQS